MSLHVRGIATGEVLRLREGGADANGQTPQLIQAGPGANPCRHCLGMVAEGEPMLVLSYRPFPEAQPYAESGPIFLHQAACERYDRAELPDWFQFMEPAVIRGYSANDWIRYDTGQVVKGSDLPRAAASILADETVAYVHIRSKFGCFQCRVERG